MNLFFIPSSLYGILEVVKNILLKQGVYLK